MGGGEPVTNDVVLVLTGSVSQVTSTEQHVALSGRMNAEGGSPFSGYGFASGFLVYFLLMAFKKLAGSAGRKFDARD